MDILYLNAKDIEQIALTDAEIIGAIEDSLRAQGNGQTSIEPRVHINPDPAYNGHFNVLRGYIAPKHVAGVKVVPGPSSFTQIRRCFSSIRQSTSTTPCPVPD